MKPTTLCEYINFKSGTKGTVLKLYGTNTQAVDVEGNLIFCTGNWRATTNIQEFNGAIKALHDPYDHLRGAYCDICPDCVYKNVENFRLEEESENKNINIQWGSCNNHPHTPHLRPRGDVTLSKIYVNACKKFRKNTAEWITKGNIQLLPGEIRDMRDYLTNTGKLQDLRSYVMIILGIKLFLRVSEILEIQIENFESQYQMVKQNRVDGITIKIKGKSDKTSTRLVLFSDNENTEFCPVRHLLVYLAFTGISDGFIFPDDKYLETCSILNKRPNYTNQISYLSFLNQLKDLAKVVLNKTDVSGEGYKSRGVLGTHILRKTAYLFAYWGVCMKQPEDKSIVARVHQVEDIPVLQLANIMRSARHKTMKNASTYQRDCATLLGYVYNETYTPKNKVSPWSCIVLEAAETARTITTPSRKYQKKLNDLSIFYIETVLDMCIDEHLVFKKVLEMSMTYSAPPVSHVDSLRVLLIENKNSSTVVDSVIAIMDKAVAFQVEVLKQEFFTKFIPLSISTEVLGTVTGTIGAKKRKFSTRPTEDTADSNVLTVHSTIELKVIVERADFSKYTTMNIKNKVEWLLLLHTKYHDSRGKLDSVDRVWYAKNVSKVGTCVMQCYGGNVDAFVATLPPSMFAHRNYKCTKCESLK